MMRPMRAIGKLCPIRVIHVLVAASRQSFNLLLRNHTSSPTLLPTGATLPEGLHYMTTLVVLPAKVVSDNDPVGTYNSADRGSDRGSGYWQTNSILRHRDKLFATWQGYNPNPAKYTV